MLLGARLCGERLLLGARLCGERLVLGARLCGERLLLGARLCGIVFKLSTLTCRALSTQQPPYLASLLHLPNIPRQLRSSMSRQLIVPKAILNLGKRDFSVAAPTVWNELPITLKTFETIAIFRKSSRHIYFKLHFHHKSSVVPRSDNDFCASLFMTMLNDSVLLHL